MGKFKPVQRVNLYHKITIFNVKRYFKARRLIQIKHTKVKTCAKHLFWRLGLVCKFQGPACLGLTMLTTSIHKFL